MWPRIVVAKRAAVNVLVVDVKDDRGITVDRSLPIRTGGAIAALAGGGCRPRARATVAHVRIMSVASPIAT